MQRILINLKEVLKRKNRNTGVNSEQNTSDLNGSKPSKGSRVKKAFTSTAFVMFLVICGLSSIYTIEEDEYAVIKTFGSVVVEETPGIKFKIPFIQSVKK